jgi:hypothetical protein
MTKIATLKKRLMQDPKFKREYAKADADYVLVEALIPRELPPNFLKLRSPQESGQRSQQSLGLSQEVSPLPFRPCDAMPRRRARS